MPTKKTVAILYGGRSVEHGVSVNSARNIVEYIDKDKFEPLAIGISKSGQWFLTQGVSKDIEVGKALSLILDPHSPGFALIANGDRIKVDIIFPVLHGTDGEDGSIQGMIKAMDIPMVGTSVLGSAISMSKIISKQLLKDAGIPVTRFLTFTYNDRDDVSYEKIQQELGSPFMIKSANLGSSVGVSKVKNEADFKNALEEAFKFDDEVLAEEFITGREIECAILGNDPPQASYPGEIIISDKYEFYTFDAKYVDGEAVRIEVPAQLESDVAEKIRLFSVQAFKALHCHDFARVDLFLTEKGSIYVNEINTIPGFTNSSMYPMMWQERGLSFTDLVTKLIHLSKERYDKGKRIVREFESTLRF